MFTKEWHKGSKPTEWSFNFTLYDGNYLDKNSARILFSTDIESSLIYIDESNATIRISNAIANISYLNTRDYLNFTAHTGTLYVFFVERENNRVPEKILPSQLKLYTMQIMFKSHESFGRSFSFSTTSMQDTYNVTHTDKMVIIALSILYILSSFSTLKASKSIERKTYNFTLQALFIFPWYLIFYITLWVLKINIIRETLYWLIPFAVMIFLDLVRHGIILYQNRALGCVGLIFGVVMGYFVALFAFTFPVLNILFSFALIVNVVKKYSERAKIFKFLTWLEIGQWASISLWMAYINIYPTNIFLYCPKPVDTTIYFSIVFVQLAVLFYLQLKRSRTIVFRYTLTTSGLQKNFTKDDCAICYESLKDSEEEKIIYKTPCMHMYHAECLKKWMRSKMECPLCRAQLPTLNFFLLSDLSVSV